MEAMQYETEQSNNHSGMGEGKASIINGGGGEEDELVDVEKVIERFRMTWSKKAKDDYIKTLMRFDRAVILRTKTKKDL
jgi:hypothetical protein